MTISGLLFGCSAADVEERPERAEREEVEAPVEYETYVYEESEPEIETFDIGQVVTLSDAEITVDSVEQVDSFPMACFETYYPPANRSLFAVHISVKNTSADVIYPDGQLIGNAWLDWRAFDGSQMSYAFPGCVLEGDTTPSGGLMSGESASLPLLVEGATLETEIGWLEFDDMSSDMPVVIALADGLSLTFE